MSADQCRITRGYCRCGKYRGHVREGDLMHLCVECADVAPDRPEVAEWSRRAGKSSRVLREVQEAVTAGQHVHYATTDGVYCNEGCTLHGKPLLPLTAESPK